MLDSPRIIVEMHNGTAKKLVTSLEHAMKQRFRNICYSSTQQVQTEQAQDRQPCILILYTAFKKRPEEPGFNA
jgi:hypothetical protein